MCLHPVLSPDACLCLPLRVGFGWRLPLSSRAIGNGASHPSSPSLVDPVCAAVRTLPVCLCVLLYERHLRVCVLVCTAAGSSVSGATTPLPGYSGAGSTVSGASSAGPPTPLMGAGTPTLPTIHLACSA
jgi:hypothetical protein